MKSNNTLYAALLIFFSLGIVIASFGQVPPPPPPPRIVPIDGGAVILAILGIGYGARKLYQRDKSVS